MTIKIIKCSLPSFWYKNLIGTKMEVREETDYVVTEHWAIGSDQVWKHILKEDAEIVE